MVPRLSVKSNVAQLAKSLQIEREALPRRISTALTRTAVEVRKALQDEIQRAFDRPTPFTKRSILYQGATASTLTSAVYVRDIGRPHYLETEITGGGRPLKAFEKRMQQAGLLPHGMYAVPGEGVRLDRYGNISLRTIINILQQLVQKTGKFFVVRNKRGLPAGVWEKTRNGVRPILIFVRQPTYRPRFDFYGIAERVARMEFPIQFERAAREAAARRALRLAA